MPGRGSETRSEGRRAALTRQERRNTAAMIEGPDWAAQGLMELRVETHMHGDASLGL